MGIRLTTFISKGMNTFENCERIFLYFHTLIIHFINVFTPCYALTALLSITTNHDMKNNMAQGGMRTTSKEMRPNHL